MVIWPSAFIVYALLIILLMFVVYKIWEAIIIERKNKELAMLNNKLEQANEELAYLSEKDALTGLYNRRSFDKMLENKLQLAKKDKHV